MRILRESYEEAKRLLNENREALDKIAEYLIEKETITGKEFMKIFREVKGLPDPDAPAPVEESVTEEEKMAFDAEAEKLAEHIREEVAKIEDEEAIEMLYVNKDKDK